MEPVSGPEHRDCNRQHPDDGQAQNSVGHDPQVEVLKCWTQQDRSEDQERDPAEQIAELLAE